MASLCVLLAVMMVLTGVGFGQNVTTQQYDNTRQGVQSQETVLTPANVGYTSFGKLFSLPVIGHVYAQPLYMSGLTMADGSVHNVLFVATEQDYLYAFDADGNNPAQGYLWRDFLVGARETWVTSADVNSTDIYPDIGITGTPVIDPTTNTLYVVAKSKTTSGTVQFFQRLHALNLADGTETMSGPTVIVATVPGTGDGGTTVSFNPLLGNQRAGLLLAATPNGASAASVFITWASHGDNGLYHGWIIGYNAANISQQTAVWNDTPNGTQGGIWLSGGALSSDDQGNIFTASGNGTFDANTGGSDYGDSALSLSLNGTTLAPTTFFTPADQAKLADDDLDMGVSSMLVLPTQTGPIAHLAVEADKTGEIYLLNRDALGGYAATNNAPVETFNVGNTIRTSASFFNNTLYMAPEQGALSAWPFNPTTGLFAKTPATTSAATFGCSDCGGAGTTPVISANGSSNAIVWALDNSAREKGPAILRAYDPLNLQSVLYDSTQALNGRDTGGTAVKFTTPVVMNGHVYVGGLNTVTVYGELSSYPNVTISANPASITSGNSAVLTVTAGDATQVTVSGSDGSSYTLSPTGGTQSVMPLATTTYTATATGATGKATAATTVTVGVSGGGCMPAGAGVMICAPAPGTNVGSPVTITAGARAASGNLSALRAYIDNIAVATVNNPSSTTSFQMNQAVTVNAGAHSLVIVGYESTGGTVTASESFTVGAATISGCIPAKAGAMICAPASGANVSSPVTITAGALAASGNLAALRAYVDNVSVATVNNPSSTTSFQMTQAVTVAAGSHSLVIVGYETSGGTVTASESFTVGSAPSSGCIPSTASAMICAPSPGASTSSPVTITAGALAANGNLAALRAYVDNVSVATVNNPSSTTSFQMTQAVPVAAGSHSLVVVGYETSGGTVTASESFSVGGSSSCAPASMGAAICSPANGATVASPVSLVAGATTSSGYLAAIRVYVDGVAAALVNNPQTSMSFSINQPVALSAGTHTVVVVGYPSTGGSVTATETVTSQ